MGTVFGTAIQVKYVTPTTTRTMAIVLRKKATENCKNTLILLPLKKEADMKIKAICDSAVLREHCICWIIGFDGGSAICVKQNGEIIYAPFTAITVCMDDFNYMGK